MTEINLNDAEISTGDYELIPDGTIAKVSMLVKPGGEGEGGWLTQAASGNLYLNCEFVVTEGKYARRKFWQVLVLVGGKKNEKGESMSANISKATLRAIVESAKGVDPKDTSEDAKAKRVLQSFDDLNGLEFTAKIKIEKGTDGYADKNNLGGVIASTSNLYLGQGSVTVTATATKTEIKSSEEKKEVNVPDWAR